MVPVFHMFSISCGKLRGKGIPQGAKMNFIDLNI